MKTDMKTNRHQSAARTDRTGLKADRAGNFNRGTLDCGGGTLESAVLDSKSAFWGTLEEKKEVSPAYVHEREIPKKCLRCPPGVPPLGSKRENEGREVSPWVVSIWDIPFRSSTGDGMRERCPCGDKAIIEPRFRGISHEDSSHLKSNPRFRHHSRSKQVPACLESPAHPKRACDEFNTCKWAFLVEGRCPRQPI